MGIPSSLLSPPLSPTPFFFFSFTFIHLIRFTYTYPWTQCSATHFSLPAPRTLLSSTYHLFLLESTFTQVPISTFPSFYSPFLLFYTPFLLFYSPFLLFWSVTPKYVKSSLETQGTTAAQYGYIGKKGRKKRGEKGKRVKRKGERRKEKKKREKREEREGKGKE